MIDWMKLGEIPAKPHIQFEHNGSLCYEECFTRQGFDGAFSILYHQKHPTRLQSWNPSKHGFSIAKPAPSDMLLKRHFQSQQLPVGGNMVDTRTPILMNRSVVVSVAKPSQSEDFYFANGDADELHFIHEGSGHLETMFGIVPFVVGDYVCIPRSTLHRWHWKTQGYVLTFESLGYIDFPKQFRNASGQFKMDAPYSHRDFVRPQWPENGLHSINGPSTMVVKKANQFSEYSLGFCPLDIVGWEGFVYPFAFNINNYQPKTGMVHLPPTIHLTFAGKDFIICSFVPRLTDTHEKAIPCPYPHSSVDCDEAIFYVKGNFTSRKGVSAGSISLHPAGIPHGPHPGTYEASIGHKTTSEMAVMIDTFETLTPTLQSLSIEDQNYMMSWK